jgi:hypothetical protein
MNDDPIEHELELDRGDDPQHEPQLHRGREAVPIDFERVSVPDEEVVRHNEHCHDADRQEQSPIWPRSESTERDGAERGEADPDLNEKGGRRIADRPDNVEDTSGLVVKEPSVSAQTRREEPVAIVEGL